MHGREIAVESQVLSCDARGMRVLIVEPSPLAQNMYRVLLQRYCPDAEIETLESLSKIAPTGPGRDCVGIILGGQVFGAVGCEHRALLSDVEAWQAVPKLVIAQPLRPGHAGVWEGLPNMQVLERPFRPEAFADCAAQFVSGGQ